MPAPDGSSCTPCPICGSTNPTHFFTKHGYSIARCGACGVLYVSPMPSDEELQAHYQDPAYFKGHDEQGYDNYSDIRKALIPLFRRRLRVLARHFPGRGRLLDYGCADGYFLEMARAEGWQIAGVERSRLMGQEASRTLGIPVVDSVDSLAEEPFDAITLWEVMEHLPRPVQVLRCLRDRLRPGGLLMLSTPNAGHWQALREPESWTGYRPPSHLTHFTRDTLQKALGLAGFERMAVRGVSPLPPLPGLVRRATAPLQQGLAAGRSRAWPVALFAWRAIRVLGWLWQGLAHRHGDIFATLEATASRPI